MFVYNFMIFAPKNKAKFIFTSGRVLLYGCHLYIRSDICRHTDLIRIPCILSPFFVTLSEFFFTDFIIFFFLSRYVGRFRKLNKEFCNPIAYRLSGLYVC